MAFFDVSDREQADASQGNPLSSITAEQLEGRPGVFTGFGAAVGNAFSESTQYGLMDLYDEAGDTPSDQAARAAKRAEIGKTVAALRPDPATTGLAGQIASGFISQVGAYVGNLGSEGFLPNLAAIDTTRQFDAVEKQIALQQGLDPETAAQIGRTKGTFAGLGVVLPMEAGGGLAVRALTGAAINTGVSVAEQKVLGAELEAGGYHDLAAQYRQLDYASLASQAVLGALFGAVGGRGRAPERAPTPSEVDAALVANRNTHIDLDTAPGAPLDTATRQAHVATVLDSTERLAAGEPVRAEEVMRGASFADLNEPGLDADAIIRQTLADEGVPHLEADVARLTGEAQGRGIETELLQPQRPVTDTPEFRAFFGDSKVVDEAGRPLVVYHGTTADITSFDPKLLGETTQADSARSGFFFTSDSNTAGAYANAFSGRTTRNLARLMTAAEKKAQRTNNPKDWDAYDQLAQQHEDAVLAENPRIAEGANILPVYLNIKNPLVVDFTGRVYEEDAFNKAIAKAKSEGHDGVVFKNAKDNPNDSERQSDVYVTFKPEQIKSATGNRGTFDPKDPNILRAITESIRRGRPEPTEPGPTIGPTKQVRNTIAQAAKSGDITPEAGRLATWLLDQNPAIAKDLSILVRDPRDGVAAGAYNPVQRLVTLFRKAGDDETAVHEVLHHAERLMPYEVQQGIRGAWLADLERIAREQPERAKAVEDAKAAAAGDKAAADRLVADIQSGKLPHEFYQYTNPSEYWAANAARLIAARAGAEGWTGKAAQWLREFIQKAREAFGLKSDAALLRGLDAVLKSDGSERAGRQLTGGRGELPQQGPLEDNPAMTIPTDDGRIVPATEAIQQADADVKSASALADTFTDAAECALRFGT